MSKLCLIIGATVVVLGGINAKAGGSLLQKRRDLLLIAVKHVPDHSAGSDSATELVFCFRLRAASHRQMT